ncbi:hypothetical protein [Staphylococcus pettenkoferi]|uniref:Uncharacterized protein n=1 Tax=Staphylococcus pettenkoferi TaxID=170573 RepID=A0ABT4BM97_9STAP|nr:hypothetical protein [Staphylococcus pettenkoferi]MCY1565004.1 hypothetical protein [Staphylococcus pettenkoferi]MCY1572648.1 hypothetical protein [Staphylococcus pettenkoferi]MCY1583806.1 hypothetical protein [Staphylococcus pettenkoferi]MCY1590210.1 hypothetical protein [Staphylococcus pettenkoferi]MCY1591968.1 hypothetical protein [Staphylococcus pettenkoferi]
MRIIILSILAIINMIFVVQAFTHPLSINNFSLKVMLVVFSLVMNIVFLLIRTTRLTTWLSVITLIIALVHAGIIAHTAYTYIY